MFIQRIEYPIFKKGRVVPKDSGSELEIVVSQYLDRVGSEFKIISLLIAETQVSSLILLE